MFGLEVNERIVRDIWDWKKRTKLFSSIPSHGYELSHTFAGIVFVRGSAQKFFSCLKSPPAFSLPMPSFSGARTFAGFLLTIHCSVLPSLLPSLVPCSCARSFSVTSSSVGISL
uniref:Uncharacterized protein n=1 Tax=Rhodosorus marinus TaxID=101924 RepID=A0A7S3EG25_9RHOD